MFESEQTLSCTLRQDRIAACPPDGSLHIITAAFRGAKNGSADYFDCAVVAVWRRWRSVLGHGGRLGTWSHWPDRPRHCGCLSALWIPWQTGSAPLALSRRCNRHCLILVRMYMKSYLELAQKKERILERRFRHVRPLWEDSQSVWQQLLPTAGSC